MASVWQQLGGLIYAGENVTEDRLKHFSDVGGRWIAPVTVGDDVAGPKNVALLEWYKQVCAPLKIKVGIWANYWGEDAEKFATEVAAIVHQHDVGPVLLDCESSVQGNTKLSGVMKAMRAHLPTRSIGVSTNSANDSVVWNGRIEGLAPSQWKSARRLNVRVLPQWYNSPRYEGSCWTDPVCNFKWLTENGMQDNFHDATYADNRAVMLKHVHPTVEATGVEDADLAGELENLASARAIGLGPGFSYYTLDMGPEADLERMRGVRGQLFLV